MFGLERREVSKFMQLIEIKAYDDIFVGDSAELARTLKPQDIEIFAVISGDLNPAHVDAEYAKTDMFHGAPDLEPSNMLAEELTYLAGADAADIVLGARVPIILTRRAKSPFSQHASFPFAQLIISNGTNAVS